MSVLSYRRIKHLLLSLGLAAFLSACGGSSEDNANNTASASSSSMHSQVVSQPDANTQDNAVPSNQALAQTFLAVSSASDSPFGQDPNNYALTFKDEFDGNLNRDVWNTRMKETSNSTTNYATRNGALKIWPERGKNGEFFDRTLDTDGSFSQRYGYFEIEAKLPKGKGVWPAFWLLNYQGGRRPEIDILEAYPGGAAPWGAPDSDGVPVAMMYAPVVWADRGERAGYTKVATPNLSAGFHRYGLKWEPNKTTFYFDGREVYSLNVAISDPLYLVIDLWYGSASGDTDASTPTGESNAFEINYVKAWQFR